MLLVTSGTIQQNVLQDQLDTIKRSCTKDHQKTHRTRQETKQISEHRVTDCLTQINNIKGSKAPRNVSIPFYKPLTERSSTNNYFRIKTNVRKWTHARRRETVNKETLTPPSSQSSTRRRSAKSAKNACKRKDLLHMWSHSAGTISRKGKHFERTNVARYNSLKQLAVAIRGKRPIKTTQSRSPHLLCRKAPFPEAQHKHFEGCADRLEQRRLPLVHERN